MIQINCPSCGSPVVFKTELSVYGTCASCGTVSVRQDVNLEAIGKVAELQPDGTPLQLGVLGSYRGKTFEVVGRIQITYGDGFWNEWFLHFNDGRTGWLGEAMGEYFVSFEVALDGHLPAMAEMRVGHAVRLSNTEYVVTNLRTARVVAFQGELPFLMQTGYNLPFADLRSDSRLAATLDYSEEKPKLFLGEYAEFEDLAFKGLRDPAEIDEYAVQSGLFVKSLNCPSCGAPHEIHGGPRSNTLACQFCDAVIDVSNPQLNIIYRAEQARSKMPPAIPIGSVAKVGDLEWTCIGFLRRSVSYEGLEYPWSEYLLHNAFKGYHWLIESNGHWSLLRPMAHVPRAPDGQVCSYADRDRILDGGKVFRHFQSGQPRVLYVAGEFYWRVRVGDLADTHDYVAPPEVISLETTSEGMYWSRGTYLAPDEVWRMFGLQGTPPYTMGVASNQPNDYDEPRRSTWRTYWIAAALAVLAVLGLGALTPSQPAFKETYAFMEFEPERARTSKPFELKGRSAGVLVDFNTTLNNRWLFVEGALVNQKTNKTYPFGKTMSYYYGEGNRNDSVFIPAVPPGTYVLRVQPQSGSTGRVSDVGTPTDKPSKELFKYIVSVRRAGPSWGMLLLLLLGMVVVPAWMTLRYNSFESQRWMESDHAA
ncbi:MAG: DUF4178 domain-containing protein [Armatimonadetes bacterium]|nr:DUF4178 domain-containing protein [Armatimonadota bacterium]